MDTDTTRSLLDGASAGLSAMKHALRQHMHRPETRMRVLKIADE